MTRVMKGVRVFGFFKRKSRASPLPSAGPEPERYAGRPQLVLLENYVLDCIGCLSARAQDNVLRLVQQAYGGGADWRRTLRERLAIDPKLDDRIRSLWQMNTAIADKRKERLHPVQFAKRVVDTNFAHLLR